MDIFSRELKSFRHVPFLEIDLYEKYESYTRAIIEDHKGNILIANTNGIFIYDTSGQGFRRFLKDITDYGTTQQEGIRDLLIDRSNRIWIGSLGYGLYGYDLNKKEVIASPSLRKGISIHDKIYTLAEDHEGEIWVGTDNGVYIIESDLSSVEPLPVNSASELIVKNIREIYFENGNRIWIGTDGEGLCLYNRDEKTLKNYVQDDFNSYSINHNSVYSIIKDKQGILWVGTTQGGVNYAQVDREKKFYYIKNETGNPNSLALNIVTSVFKDREGNLWIGTDGGGLDMYDQKRKIFKHFVHKPGSKNSINGNSILCITEDETGNIWVGGYLMGINIIQKRTGLITGYRYDPENASSLSNDDVRDILIENQNTIWIATNGGGLNKLNPETGIFSHFSEGGNNSIVGNWCLKLYKDRYGNIWIGTYSGISIYNSKDNTFRNFEKSNDPSGLSNAWIYTLAEDKSGDMWIGTANGLNYYNRITGKFTKFLSSDGLPNDVINGILLDVNHNLWLNTNKGISKFNPGDTTFQNYDQSDGLQGNQFIHGSYYKNAEGRMYFGGINGLNVFDPDSILDNTYLPPVYLTDFLIDYREVAIGERNSPLKRSITESEKITLTHKQSVFTIKYTALNCINSEKNQYAYMLEGFDKDWNYIGTRREATYTNLNPGVYTFRVIASNNDGYWNKEGTSVLIEVLPPWWKTWVFRLFLVLAILRIAIGFYIYRINILQQQKIQLERIVKERTRELQEKSTMLAQQADELSEINTILEENQQQIKQQAEGLAEANKLLEERQRHIEEQTEELLAQKEELEKANQHLAELNTTKDKFFSIIAHDLKNPFNTILGFSELLSENYLKLSEDKKQNFAQIIFKASKNVFNLLENLLLWVRSQTDRVKFEPSEIELNSLIVENISLLQEMSQHKNISIQFSITDTFTAYADRNMINTVIRNLLTNAIKFTGSAGTIRVDMLNENGFVHVRVADSGVGISPEEIGKLFRVDVHYTKEGTDGETGTGLGLILCYEYIMKNKGKIWVESKPGKGSTFHFTLPQPNPAL